MLTRNILVTCLFLSFSLSASLPDNFKPNEQGYVDANLCASCHKNHFDGFQHVGMSQSFRDVSVGWFTDDKLKLLPFYHKNSERYYDIDIADKRVYFQRYQLDSDGNKVNEIRVEINYILGSGNKATSFLFRTANDELYLLPINWYSEDGFWEMSPGFEKKQHFGLSRQVLRECMFCHNAFPQQEMEEDIFWQRDTFPEELKSGIDCQRCHGPGKNHLEKVYSNDANLQAIRESIVNPAKLPVEQRDSVCFQCHMLPSVAMVGMRRFDRTDYSFRPGELLSDYLVHVDIVDEKIPQEARFEINHHAYRLSNSQCFTQSQGELTCISCHNPHEKPSTEVFKQRVANTCIDCHSLPIKEVHEGQDIGDRDCVSCHMPQRRTQDVIHAVMTDHNIGVFSDIDKLQDPVVKQTPLFLDISLLDNTLGMSVSETDIYRLVSLLQTSPSAEYAGYLKTLLQREKYPHLKPYVVLAETLIKLKQYDEAQALLNYLKNQFESNIRIEELLTIIFVATGRAEEAEEGFKWLIKVDDSNADLFFNYGLLKYQQGEYNDAYILFDKAHLLRENFANAVLYKGKSKLALEKESEAINFFLASLQIEPMLDRSYLQLINLYHKHDNRKQASRYYRLALKNATDPKAIKRLALETEKQYLSVVE